MPSPPEILSAPVTLPGGLVLPNRIAKAAMSEVLAEPSGAPGERLIRLYERLGRGGAGLLITGHVIVDRGGLGEPGNVLIEDGRHLEALRRWAAAAQAQGARAFVQLTHTGRQSPRRLTPRPVAPSAVAMRGFFGLFATPRELTASEIEGIVRRFGDAAAIVKDAGFAGVQLHGAHGYLVSQFLSPLTNRRDDAWGGDGERRVRFVLEVVRAMRARVGPRFPIAVKLNSADFQRGGFELEDALEVARALEREGIDVLEVSGGNYESPAMSGSGELASRVRESTRLREAYFLEYARAIRAAVRIPLMLTGGMRSASVMADAIGQGVVDLVGLARPIALEPDLPARLISGQSRAARAVPLRTGIRKIDDLLQIFWFQTQLHRMAEGREPDAALSKWRALAEGVRSSVATA
ncbi:MAG: NADH:flavin oxidoreductase/NADH oxidase family protein [Sandaracinaceae bacterium]|nr:NADH:flavin oxidoreductase/NADH oxidase family protein [Sandaracinaceae bacterium]